MGIKTNRTSFLRENRRGQRNTNLIKTWDELGCRVQLWDELY